MKNGQIWKDIDGEDIQAHGKFYYMIDHWNPLRLRDSGYSILPITIGKDGKMKIEWQDEWTGLAQRGVGNE